MTRLPHRLPSLLMSLLLTAVVIGGSGPGVIASQDGGSQPCLPQAATPEPATAATPTPSEWTQLPEMPRPRSELGAAVVGGTIFVVGGFGGMAMLDCYHTTSGTWSAGADLPRGVHHPGVAALGGLVYVAGGYTKTGVTDAVWAYDPASNTWEARAPLPEPRGAFGMVALDGRLYAVGGALERRGGPAAGSVVMYDPATDSWAPRAQMPTPREHLGGGFPGVFTQGQVVVLGGERGTRACDTVEAYDPARGEWRALPPMPTARHGLAAVVIGGAIYAIGGSTQARVAENTGANEAIRANPPT